MNTSTFSILLKLTYMYIYINNGTSVLSLSRGRQFLRLQHTRFPPVMPPLELCPSSRPLSHPLLSPVDHPRGYASNDPDLLPSGHFSKLCQSELEGGSQRPPQIPRAQCWEVLEDLHIPVATRGDPLSGSPRADHNGIIVRKRNILAFRHDSAPQDHSSDLMF